MSEGIEDIADEAASDGALEVPVDGLSEVSVDEDRSERAALTRFFQALERLVTVLRVYPAHHPVAETLAARSLERLRELFEKGEVSVLLTPSEVQTLSGEMVFSRELAESKKFFWYAAHSDGLREMTFEPGFDTESLQRLMRVIDRVSQGSVGADDDAITLLWELHLPCFHYRSVDSFVDTEILEEFNGRTADEAVDLVIDAAIAPDEEAGRELGDLFGVVGLEGLDWFSNQRVRHALAVREEAVEKEHLDFGLAQTPEKLDRLLEEWDSGENLEFRFIQALLGILRTNPGSAAAEHARQVIEVMTLEMIDREMYGSAARVLELLEKNQELFGGDEDPLAKIQAAISDPLVVEGLLWRVQSSEEHRGSLLRLVPLLDVEAVEAQVIKVVAENDDLPAMAPLVDLLFRELPPQTARAPLPEEYLEDLGFVGRMIEHLDGRQLRRWPPSREVVLAGLNAQDQGLRRSTLGLEATFWNDEEVARRGLLPLTRDGDEGIRRLTYGLLADYQPLLFAEDLGRVLEAGDLKDRTIGELKFLFEGLMKADPTRVGTIREFLKGTRGWLDLGGRRRAAVAAARVLAPLGDEEALAMIRDLASGKLNSPKLRTSMKQVLERYDTSSGPVGDSGPVAEED